MNLQFFAQEVSYSEALDGEIVQVIFQEEPDPEIDYSKKKIPLLPPIKYVMFSASYEFPPYEINVEWCDGKDYDGMKLIKEVVVSKTELKVVLEDGSRINIEFNTDRITFGNIKRFLLSAVE
jgi:hypothetical protein